MTLAVLATAGGAALSASSSLSDWGLAYRGPERRFALPYLMADGSNRFGGVVNGGRMRFTRFG